jgi:GDP-mannose 6-dehydrogenase
MLIGKGCDLKIYDPHFDPSQVMGANKDYIENAIPHVGKLLVSEPDHLLEDLDLLIIGHNSDEAREWIADVPDGIEILDLVRLDGLSDKPNGTGLYW